MNNLNQDWLLPARNVLQIEAETISAQIPLLNDTFIRACQTIMSIKGRLVVMGMGKSGHIGAKLAATFASTGTPSFFVHPAEAEHGDLGMITQHDCILALSYSGESHEIMTLIPIVQQMGVKVISITGNPNSSIATRSDIHLPIYVEREACPLGLAPTSSSTATLALGDALAVTLIKVRDFSMEDFARSHPGGRLGRRLITKVCDVMRQSVEIPKSAPTDILKVALFEITDKKLGVTLVCESNQLLGIYTDGDLRRTLEKGDSEVLNHPIARFMTKNPRTTTPNQLATEALEMMEKYQITVLPVLDDDILVGILHIHDLLSAGVA
ncbi:MAG: D-arabinose 5-phosphate isomerase [Cardiobacteriales bacterium]|nr:MAG: D-arabinose 5-phosphate isomerase [Cardiobacteriales bacterium]